MKAVSKALALTACLKLLSARPVSNDGAAMQIIQTTTTASGQTIDWVPIDSQGVEIAAPPPPPGSDAAGNATQPDIKAMAAADPGLHGPAGTVPILRANPGANAPKRLPGMSNDTLIADSDAGVHWYASTAQGVANHGGIGTLSMFRPYVQSGSDFSLLQTAIIRSNVPVAGGGTTSQTLEAGWINYPNQVSAQHIFTYFTTCGYAQQGANIGGWNRDQAGWVQVDATVFPGYAFSQIATDGGTQYDLNIQYQLYQGNWWLWVVNSWIGYYPANVFTKGVSSGSTLETSASSLNWYGEIYNSETAETTTDMGSGELANTGFGHAGYIHNIAYLDTNGNSQAYDGSGGVVVSDSSRYSLQTAFNSGSSWGSYMYLGGPGAGGKVGG